MIHRDRSSITFGEVLDQWQANAEFRSFFISLLADAKYEEFRWETPPVTNISADRVFECVLLDSPGLAPTADPEAFADFFDSTSANDGVVSFPNLGRDALLVVPCPEGPLSAYRQLATFLREAPDQQKHSLWRTVGEVMKKSLGPTPRWLSTAGAGVSWLHVRIDKRPKYYGYRPYREY